MSGAPMSPRPDPAPLLSALRRALADGDADRALQLGAEAARQDRPEPVFALCAALLERRDPQAGGVLAVLERFADHAPGWLEIGTALLTRGQPKAALVAFDRAAAHGTASERRRAALGRAAGLEAQGRPAEAAEALERAQAGVPEAALDYRRGVLLRRAGRLAAAQAALERATALAPDHAEALFALGLVHQDGGAHEAAAAAYRAALERRPDFHEAALNLGTAEQHCGRWEAALDAYARAVRLRPDSLGRVAQALSAAPRGRLWLDPAALAGALAARG